MEFKGHFEVVVNYLKEFHKSKTTHRRYSYHKDGNGDFCIGKIENSCVYQSTGGGQIIYCENIKANFGTYLLLFGNIDLESIDSNNCRKSVSNIKGNFKMEIPTGYFFRDLDYSSIDVGCYFLIRQHLAKDITEILLQESKKIKNNFVAKVSINFTGDYIDSPFV